MNIQRSFRPPDNTQPVRLTTDAYLQMGALLAGRFEKTELLDGTIYEMPTDGPLTRLWNRLIVKWIITSMPEGLGVVSHQTLPLGDHWAPSPDHYVFLEAVGDDKVSGGNVLLIIELSDTTLAYDLGGKADAYAKHGVREYWVVDPNSKKVYAHRLDANGKYGDPIEYSADDKVGAALIPGLVFCISELFRNR